MSLLSDNTKYYSQLEQESIRVKDRAKEQSRVVQFIIDKQKKIKETFNRLRKETDDSNQKMMIHQNTYSYKNFKTQIKYDFQLSESKISELEDFHIEVNQMIDFFSVGVYEQQNNFQKSRLNIEVGQMAELFQGAFQEPQILQKSRMSNQSQPPELVQKSRIPSSQLPINESSEFRGQELQAASLKLYSELQTYIKSIETIISEQKRFQKDFNKLLQNLICFLKQEYKSLNQGLLQLLQDFPKQDKQNQDTLNSLYSQAALYFRLVEAELQKYLNQQILLINDLRTSMAGIEKLVHVEAKVKETIPSFDAYLETLERLLQSLGNASAQSLPQPQQFNDPLLQYLKTLRGQFKLSVINAQNNKYFNNLLDKIQKRGQQNIQKIKQQAESQNTQTLEIHQFLVDSLELQKNSQQLADQIENQHLKQGRKLTREGIKQIMQSFRMLDANINQINEKKLHILKWQTQDKNTIFKNLLDILNLQYLDPTLLRLVQLSKLTQEYDQLGDINAVLRLSEVSEALNEKKDSLLKYLQMFIQESGQQIRTSNEPEILEQKVHELQMKTIQIYRGQIQSLISDVQKKNIPEKKSLECEQLIEEYAQVTSVVEGLQRLIGALQYLTLGNIQNLSCDIQITDNSSTPIDQMLELMVEQVGQIGKQIERNYKQPWLIYRADEYEKLIISEEPGYIWMSEILKHLDLFKNNWRKLFHQEQILSSCRQDEWQPLFFQRMKIIVKNTIPIPQQFSSSLGQAYLQDGDVQDNTRVNLQIKLNELIALQKEGFQLNVYESLFSFKPESVRWDYYFSLLHRQSSLIFLQVYYSPQFIQHVETDYSGLVLSGTESGKKKTEELVHWIRNCKNTVIQTFSEIFQGIALTHQNLEEIIKFTVILHQLHERIKQILETRKQKLKQQSQKMNMDMIPHSESQYDANLKDIGDYLSQFKQQITEQVTKLESIQEGGIQFQSRYAQLPMTPDLININRLIPLALIFLSHAFQGKLKDFFFGLVHIYTHSAWIEEFISRNQIINLADPTSLDLLYKINRIILYTPLLPLKVNDALQDLINPNGLSKFIIGQMKNLQKQFEDIILSDIQKQQFQELYKQSFLIKQYEDISHIANGLVESLKKLVPIYVPKEIHEKCFLEFMLIRVQKILEISCDLYDILQTQKDKKYGYFVINLSQLKQSEKEIIRWGSLSSKILFQLSSNKKNNQVIDFESIDDKSFPSSHIQEQLEQAWNNLG